jgi:hypothetical protein
MTWQEKKHVMYKFVNIDRWHFFESVHNKIHIPTFRRSFGPWRHYEDKSSVHSFPSLSSFLHTHLPFCYFCFRMTVNEEEQSQSRPSLRKYTLPRLRSWLHVSQVVFTLLSVCMVAPIVAVQLAYKVRKSSYDSPLEERTKKGDLMCLVM